MAVINTIGSSIRSIIFILLINNLILFQSAHGSPNELSKQPLSVNSILAEIDMHGAKKTLHQLDSSESQYMFVLENIEKGSAPWLTVAKRLLEVADAGDREQLHIALGVAIKIKPALILVMFNDQIQYICTGPDIDEPEYDTYEKAVRELNTRIAIVKTVTEDDPTVKDARAHCLSSFDSSMKNLKVPYGIE